jgi:hypothetical protein
VTTGSSSDSGSGSESGSSPTPNHLFQEKEAAGLAVFDAVENVIDPTNQTHSIGVFLQAAAVSLAIALDVDAANGALAGASQAVVDAAILQVINMTATPNQNQWDGGYSNPTNNELIAYYNAILEFFDTNDLSS